MLLASAQLRRADACAAQAPPSRPGAGRGPAGHAATAAAGRVRSARDRAARAEAGEVESDPIRCWWKADRTSVRVGEQFGLVLTCGVIETGPITVVPVLNQLEPGALSSSRRSKS